MNYLLLDTNIYLHCQSFDTLPWDVITGQEGSFAILLPMQILRELDSVKDRAVGPVNKRAKRVSRILGDILLDGTDSKFALISCEVPTADCFYPGFSAEIADDVILMSALKYMEGKDGDKLIVISRDNPLLLKAKQAKLAYVRMPEEYSLTNTEEDKEKKQLEEELRKYKNRLPKPYLAFGDKTNVIRIKRVKPRTVQVDTNLSQEEQDFLACQEEEAISRERFKFVDIFVFNDGNAPTGAFSVHLDTSKLKHCRVDIRTVSIDIPDSFQTEEDKQTDWGFCEKPYKIFAIYAREDSWPLNPRDGDENEPLTHGMSSGIREIELDLWDAESGSIDWTIYDPALPDAISGTLHFIIED